MHKDKICQTSFKSSPFQDIFKYIWNQNQKAFHHFAITQDTKVVAATLVVSHFTKFRVLYLDFNEKCW